LLFNQILKMKAKITAALKTKYSALGFGQAAIEAVGDYLAKSVTEEAQIETAIGGVEPLLKVFQSEADKLRADKATATKELEDLKAKQAAGGEPKPQPKPKDGDDDLDAKIAAAIAKAIQPVQTELEGYKTREAASARANLITSKAKELGIPEYRINEGFAIPPDADEATITAALTTVKQNLVTAGLSSESPLPLTDGKSDFVGLMKEIGSKNDKN
jgi:hypothetical protein